MCRILLSMALVWSLVAGTVFAQSAEQRSGQRPTGQPPRVMAIRPSAGTPEGPRTAPPKQFDRQPQMVSVQALIVTVSFGEAGNSKSPAGSVADALAEKINAEIGDKKTPMAALISAMDGVLKEKAKTASIETFTGLELVTVAGQTASVQIGHRKPRIVGATFSQRGRSNNVQMENVGSIVQITPQVVPDGSLVVAVDIEKSDLGPEAEGKVIAGLEDGTQVRSPQIDTLMARTTVTAANGQVVVLGNLVCSQQVSRKETFVLLRPLLVDASDGR